LFATYIGLYGTIGTESSFATAISCLAYASIGMIITPGGIGAYAYFMAKVLELNGIDYTLGLANGTQSRLPRREFDLSRSLNPIISRGIRGRTNAVRTSSATASDPPPRSETNALPL
jgi:hypothetical protein